VKLETKGILMKKDKEDEEANVDRKKNLSRIDPDVTSWESSCIKLITSIK